MKKHLKFLSLMLSAACAVSLFACEGKKEESQKTPQNQQPIIPPPPSHEQPEDPEDPEILTLSKESGVYTSAFTLTLETGEDSYRVYYTTDGTLPTTASTQYTDGIVINNQKLSFPLTDSITWDRYGYGYYYMYNERCCTALNFLVTDGSGRELLRRRADYFISADGADDFPVPVVSLTMPYQTFVSFYNDIAKESKERAELAYYDFSSGESFALNTQIKIGGNWTKGFPYRTMNVNFNKDENGKKNKPVTVDLFEGRAARDGGTLTDFKRFRLHSGGNAQTTAWFTDAFVQKVAAEVDADGEYLNCATTGYRPCEVYLNGEYWGVYAIREHYSDVYFEQNYGVDKDDVILLDRTTGITKTDDTFSELYAIEVAEDDEDGQGMRLATEFFEYLLNTDFTQEANYEELQTKVDLTSLCDLILTHCYASNWDFMYNNIKMWRTAHVDPDNPYADGRWRFCLHDLDQGFGNQWGDAGIYGSSGYLLADQYDTDSWRRVDRSHYSNPEITYRPGMNYVDFCLGLGANQNGYGPLSDALTCMLTSPMQNDKFRELFYARAEIVQAVYTDSRAEVILREMQSEIELPMQRHIAHWNRSGYSASKWQNEVNTISQSMEYRPYMKDLSYRFDGGLMYVNGDYFKRQIEAAIWRFDRYR